MFVGEFPCPGKSPRKFFKKLWMSIPIQLDQKFQAFVCFKFSGSFYVQN